MPYDSTLKAVIGADAKTPLDWARKTFCTWLAGKLNDPAGDYASTLGLTTERLAFVLEDLTIARDLFKRADAPPVVSLMQGPVDSRDWYVSIAGQERKGERFDVEWTLDMGVADATPTDDDLAAERRDDSNLASLVRDAVKHGYNELNELGLFNLDIEADAEKQRAGRGRNPHSLTLFIRTLRDYTP